MNVLYGDIKALSPAYNLHTHTQFCDGRKDMSDFVSAALEIGYKVIGFSPHSPIGVPSPCNMSYEDVPKYMAEIEKLRIYSGDLRILSGMEVDFLNGLSGPHSPYFQDLGLDYIIGSVHFIKDYKGEFVDVDGRPETFSKKLKDCFRNDIRYVVESYYDAVGEMLVHGGFDIIGHIDKIGFNADAVKPGIEQEDWYDSLVNQVLDEALKCSALMEINTKAYETSERFFPSERYWKKLVEARFYPVINSDAHYPDRLQSGRRQAFIKLKQLEDGKYQ